MSRPGRVRQSTLSQHRHKTSPEHESLRGCGRGGRAHQCAAEESIYTNKNVRVVGRRGEDGERVTYIRQGSLLAHVVPRRDDLAALAEARLRDFGEVRSSVEDGPEATGRVVPRHRLAITRALDRRRDAAARSAASTGLRRTVVVVLGQDAVAAVRAAVVVGRRRRVARVGLVAAVASAVVTPCKGESSRASGASSIPTRGTCLGHTRASGRVKPRQARVGPGRRTYVLQSDARRTTAPGRGQINSINTTTYAPSQVPPRRRQLDAGHEVPVQVAQI